MGVYPVQRMLGFVSFPFLKLFCNILWYDTMGVVVGGGRELEENNFRNED